MSRLRSTAILVPALMIAFIIPAHAEPAVAGWVDMAIVAEAGVTVRRVAEWPDHAEGDLA